MHARSLRRASVLFAVLFTSTSLPGFAAPNDTDVTFGTKGVTTVDFSGDDPEVADLAGVFAIARDGIDRLHVLAIAISSGGGPLPLLRQYQVLRFTKDGILDSSFGVDGSLSISSTNRFAGLLVDDVNQRLLLTGADSMNDHAIVARFLLNGTRDPSFGDAGQSSLPGRGTVLKLSADGDILLAGSANIGNDNFVGRLNSDGTPDMNFGEAGLRTLTHQTERASGIASISEDSDGNLLLCGPRVNDEFPGASPSPAGVVIARLSSGGALDASLGTNGVREVDFGFRAACLAAQSGSGGAFSVAAYKPGSLTIARLKENGTLDDSFDGDGLQSGPLDASFFDLFPLPTAVVQSDGKLVLAGTSQSDPTKLLLTRVEGSPDLKPVANGSPDTNGDSEGGGGAFDWAALIILSLLFYLRRNAMSKS